MDNRSKFWRGVMVGVPCYSIRLPGDSGGSAGIYICLDGASLTISTGASGAGKFTGGGERRRSNWQSDSRYGARQQKAYGASDDY